MAKRYYLSMTAIVLTILVFIWGFLYYNYNNQDVSQSIDDSLQHLENEPLKKAEAMDLAQKYIDGIPKGVVMLDESETSTQKEIDEWKKRIRDFAKKQCQDQPTENELCEMATQSTSLFRLIKEASIRKDEGLDPYTPLSGFNTMTLIMKMDLEFKKKLGYTFSEFMLSQDIKQIKHQLKSEKKG